MLRWCSVTGWTFVEPNKLGTEAGGQVCIRALPFARATATRERDGTFIRAR
jgi:hypothetical protein